MQNTSLIQIADTAIVEDGVEIGTGTSVGAYAIIRSGVKIGKNCVIHPHAIIGEAPQDRSFKQEKSFIEIGDNNIIREFVTIHKAVGESAVTKLGDNNFLMVGVHLAHNSKLGNNNTIANYVNLAGYVEIGNNVTIGGSTNIHQHCRVGDYVMISGLCGVNHDLLPYMTYLGVPARAISTNRVALKRAGMGQLIRSQIMNAFKIIYAERQSVSKILERLEELPPSKEMSEIINFIKTSKRGVCLDAFDLK